jgi:hypothetical protein
MYSISLEKRNDAYQPLYHNIESFPIKTRLLLVRLLRDLSLFDVIHDGIFDSTGTIKCKTVRTVEAT